jgi:NAD(P)H dehydrogenase (quinone)
MAQPAVVIAFSSRCGTTEMFAHAAAVGVVNARALPRLRRLADDGHPVPPECTDTFRRMQKEYVSPTEKDVVAAPALIVVPSAGMTPSSAEWQSFIALLDRLASAGMLTGKVGAVIDTGDNETVTSFSSTLAKRGIALIAADGVDARTQGRAVGAAIMRTMHQPSH